MSDALRSDFANLANLSLQPKGFRQTYELLAQFLNHAKTNGSPPDGLYCLAPEEQRRIGFLLYATRQITGLELSVGWQYFERKQSSLLPQLGTEERRSFPVNEPVFLCDPAPNLADGLASKWLYTNGVRTAQLKQIVRMGSC